MPRKPTTVFERCSRQELSLGVPRLRSSGQVIRRPSADASRMWVTPSAKPKPGNEQTYVFCLESLRT